MVFPERSIDPPVVGTACYGCVAREIEKAILAALGAAEKLFDLEYVSKPDPDPGIVIHDLIRDAYEWGPLCSEHHGEIEPGLRG